uniref:H15 domain-containing protein n=1 Tax=Amphiprion percula TaxID=161767 RepID=A0A3P8UB98_AMPPE
MAEVAPAETPAALAPAKKAPRRRSGTGKEKKKQISCRELILRAVVASKDRKGVSLSGLKKQLVAAGYDVEHNAARIRRTIRTMVDAGLLTQTKGTGASGSFKAGGQERR